MVVLGERENVEESGPGSMLRCVFGCCPVSCDKQRTGSVGHVDYKIRRVTLVPLILDMVGGRVSGVETLQGS